MAKKILIAQLNENLPHCNENVCVCVCVCVGLQEPLIHPHASWY